MKVKSESEVAQSCPTPSYPMDCSPPGYRVVVPLAFDFCPQRVRLIQWFV